MDAQEVLHFWFKEIKPEQQFGGDPQFDQRVREKFFEVFQSAMREETSSWRSSAEGRLAEIIVLDQFPRNMFRDKAEAFSGDAQALRLAKQAVQSGADQKLPVAWRAFMYMPYMHSENQADHEIAVKLFSQPGLESNLKFEFLHKKIIDRFGHYPHRNQALGRKSTPEELEFLKQKGSAF